MENENKYDNEDEISLLDLWNIFKNRFAYFLVTLIVVVIFAFAYLQTTIPLYSSSVTVLVDPIQSSSSLDEMLLSGMSSNTSKIQPEVELITSNRNLQSALSLLDLSSYTTLKGEHYDAFYKISSKSISVTSVKATNLVSITITDENPKFAADLANAIATRYDKLLTGIAKTSKTTQRVFLEKQIPLNEEDLKKANNALSDYKEESGVIQLDKKSPSLVTQIAYFDIKEERLKVNIENNNNLIDSYTSDLAKSSIVLPDPTELTNSNEFSVIKDLYSAANNELIMYNLELIMYNLANSVEINSGTNYNGSSLKTSNLLNSVEINSNTIYSGTNYNGTNYNGLSLKTSNLLNTMNSSSNKMLDIINEKLLNYTNKDAYVNKVLSEYSKIVLENVKSKIELSLLQERSKVYTTELDKLPLIEGRVTDLERNVAVLQQVGLDLRSMLEQVKLSEAAVSGNVTVIYEATVPNVPVSPNKLLIMAVAILLGMALGFLMCILVNLKDNTIKTREDLKKAIGENIPLLGWIPLFDKKGKESKERENNSIFVYNEPNSLQSEKVLSITSNLLYGKTFEKNQVIAITSSDMSAGKSMILSNIAISLVRTGAKVILIDGDLRLPTINLSFGYSFNKIGLVEVVMGKEELENVIVQPIANVPDLHILPVGHKPQVPSAILSYSHMEKIINNLKKYYDYILIDAPPVSYGSEVLTIGQLADSIILNVRANITTKDAIKELLESLVTVEEKISGVVLNGFVPSKSDFGGRSGDYGYNKYGYNNYYRIENSEEKKSKRLKKISQAKARRLAVKQYKKNLENRNNRVDYFSKLKKYAPVVQNLDFGNTFGGNNIDNSDIRNINKTFKSTINDEKEKINIEEKISYSSIIEKLKKDSEARGKKS